ncbi:MAG TPA: glycosyltransferase 87 family protein [bacterium]|nr:glycosyltransferase 87 family protein [bacterium]HOL94574.1 glycosyltransferase 87 family protein [bacterium]HXK94767.1 glycosyltransferase 87 family protein [bacterium]
MMCTITNRPADRQDVQYGVELGAGLIWKWGLLTLAGYVCLTGLPEEAIRPRSPEAWAVTRFLTVMAYVHVWYWILTTRLINGWRLSSRQFAIAMAFGLLFRLVLLPTPLILENDIYRYHWDGHISRQGINPYRYAPLDHETQPYRTEYWDRINYGYVPTIYPPVLQYVFLFSEFLFPGQMLGMKFVLLLFDLGTLYLIMRLLEALRRPREWCLIYAWSPLVLKEIANSGHADSVCAFFLTLALFLLVKNRDLASGAAMAGMTLTKFFGLLFWPILRRAWRWPAHGLYAATLVILYLPFLSLDINPFRGFWIFSREWRFNGGIFEFTVWFIQYLGGRWALFRSIQPEAMTRSLLFGVILFATAWHTFRLPGNHPPVDYLRALMAVMGTVLLCSPVINPWYFVWMVPLLCVFPSRAWILLTGLVFLSYTFYYGRSFPEWVPWVEYGIFFAVLILEKTTSEKQANRSF